MVRPSPRRRSRTRRPHHARRCRRAARERPVRLQQRGAGRRADGLLPRDPLSCGRGTGGTSAGAGVRGRRHGAYRERDGGDRRLRARCPCGHDRDGHPRRQRRGGWWGRSPTRGRGPRSSSRTRPPVRDDYHPRITSAARTACNRSAGGSPVGRDGIAPRGIPQPRDAHRPISGKWVAQMQAGNPACEGASGSRRVPDRSVHDGRGIDSERNAAEATREG